MTALGSSIGAGRDRPTGPSLLTHLARATTNIRLAVGI